MARTFTGRLRMLLILVGTAATAAIARHGLRLARGHRAPGGLLIGDVRSYNKFSHRLLGRFFAQIADHIAEGIPATARLLEVGCGPGHLAVQLARRHGLDVTGVDLDPAMVDHARANAAHSGGIDGGRPSFQEGDVAHLAFPDESFDLVISTLSMHHWADPAAGLSEVGRVLKPGGRALIWDLRPGVFPLHRRIPDPVRHVQGSPLQLAAATTWRWPWKLGLTQRFELVRSEEPPRGSEKRTDTAQGRQGGAHG